jgi:hypothetical protein
MPTGYILASESAVDVFASNRANSPIKLLEINISGIYREKLDANVEMFATGRESDDEYCAIIDREMLEDIKSSSDIIFPRIARLLKAASRPPVHLPRSWAEFHYKNRVTFFAVPENEGEQRWLVEIDSSKRTANFTGISDSKSKLNLSDWTPPAVPEAIRAYREWAERLEPIEESEEHGESFSAQVDLRTIGSKAVVQGFSYEDWLRRLTAEQKKVVNADLNTSIRVVGPAGSGKTLTLCMRAMYLAKNPIVIGGGSKILVVTHTWAMTERIDGILHEFSEGQIPESITILPLLYVLQAHAGSVSAMPGRVLGEDSSEGQKRVIELISAILNEELTSPDQPRGKLSRSVVRGLDAPVSSHARSDLVFDLYEEIIGVISAQGIMPGDSDRIAKYLSEQRDAESPPFMTRYDREFCLFVYERLLHRLVDLGAITTDQLVQDCIRVFETFTWNVKRETDGYDYILIDELQLFDSQERLAVSLLSRSKPIMRFLSVEDPSQGVFSSINASSKAIGKNNDEIYLKETHRFRAGLFEFIQFLYGKFALNAIPISVSLSDRRTRKPNLWRFEKRGDVAKYCLEKVKEISKSHDKDRRLCIVCIGEVESEIYSTIEKNSNCKVVLLSSFDDVEKLSYQHRAAVVSPWQFVGGAQFSDVILVTAGTKTPGNPHAKLRELTAIYLGASRASSSLDVICDARIPEVIQRAIDDKLITKKRVSSNKSGSADE